MKELNHRKVISMADGLLPTSRGHLKVGPARGAGRWLFLLIMFVFAGCEISGDPTIDDNTPVASYEVEAEHSSVLIKDAPFLREISGLAHSLVSDSILWVHNDGGDEARLYALSKSGNYLGFIELTGIHHQDWEDIASIHDPTTGKNYLYVGDFGDNKSRYTSYKIIRLEEPDPERYVGGKATVEAEVAEYTYSDIETQDAEALVVLPETMEVLILSKVVNNARIYSLGEPFSANPPLVANRLGTFDTGLVVGADLNMDQLLVITYVNVYCFSLKDEILASLNATGTRLPYEPEPKAGGVCWDTNNRGYYTIGELAGDSLPVLNYYKIIN
jgi:hypothetical protein